MTKRRSPIFVVGASRSGTALVRSILNNHDAVHIAGETHYFDDLRPRLGAPESELSDEQRTICEDYFLALAHRPYGHGGRAEESRLDRLRLRTLAKQIGRGTDAYFEAYCRLDEDADDPTHWGEKTPRHVFRLPEILTRYPDARAICMVRDPRAVVASYRDWRNQGGFDLEADPGHRETLDEEQERARRSYHVVLATLLWRSTVSAPIAARRRFGAERVKLQRYEDLVLDPENAVRSLANWLDLDFRPSLLDVPMHNSSVSGFAQKTGVSRDPLERWRARLGRGEVGVIEWWAGSMMREAGYERLSPRVSVSALLWTSMTLPFAILRAVAANRARIPNLPQYIWRRMCLALGSARSA